MGWTAEYEEELWSGADLSEYQDKMFVPWDKVREGYLGGIGHW
jgi:hypothetical protein